MIKLSICVSVYKTSQFLENFLSKIIVLGDNLLPNEVEIVLVNDGSYKERKLCKKLLKKFTKNTKIIHQYIEHSKNLGLVEARRTGIEKAKGEYILLCDADDYLLSGALDAFYEEIAKTDADIIQGLIQTNATEEKILVRKELIWKEKFKNQPGKFFNGFLIEQKLNGFLWGKCYKKSLLLKAFSLIPFCYCVMAEDFLIMFLVAYFTDSYSFIEKDVYFYNYGQGITGNNVINDLNKWEKICSASTVFTILKNNLREEIILTNEQSKQLDGICNNFLRTIIERLENNVDFSIKEPATEILNEYWGAEYVGKIKKCSL